VPYPISNGPGTISSRKLRAWKDSFNYVAVLVSIVIGLGKDDTMTAGEATLTRAGAMDQHLSNGFFASRDYGIDSLGINVGIGLQASSRCQSPKSSDASRCVAVSQRS
jgi:hypothetical protein